MDTDLAALAKAGAATLVGLMTSDLWTPIDWVMPSDRHAARNAPAAVYQR
jgi:hypothetical protein